MTPSTPTPSVAHCDSFSAETKPSAASDSVGQCSNVRSVFNIILTAIGIGVIMLPTVMAKCGWIGGIVVLCSAAAISNLMVGKLYIAIVSHPKGERINTYEQLGRVCFGRVGSLFTAGIVHVTMTGCCATLLLLLGENTHKLFPVLSTNLWCVVWTGVCFPLSWLKSLHEVSYVAAVGLIGVFVLFGVILVKGIQNGLTTTEEISYQWITDDPLLFGVSFGNCMLSFHITNVAATLIRDMKYPTAFPNVVSAGYLLIFVIYIGVGFSGYYGYGSTLIHTPIIDRIAPAGAPLDAWGYICVVSLLVLSLPHYLVLLLPIAASLEYAVKVDMNDNSSAATIKRAMVRFGLVGTTLVIAITVPSVSKLIDLMGVFTMTTMAGILPALFYMRMRTLNEGSFAAVFKSSKFEVCGLIAIMLLCVCMIAIGGTQAITDF